MIAPNGTATALAEPDVQPTMRVANALAGNSPHVRAVVRAITRLARSPEVAALICGEPGVGKEIVARCIHRADGREKLRLAKLDASALAVTDQVSFAWLDGAEDAFAEGGGTLLIDHIEHLSPTAQAALLGLVTRLGTRPSGGPGPSSAVRLLSLSAVDVERAVQEKRFRADLFYRLATVTVMMPPLRERREDIPLLAHQYLGLMNQQLGKQIEGFDAGALRRLMAYPWPGNVRELRSAIERAAILTQGSTVPAEHVMVSGAADELLADEQALSLAEMERRLILRVLDLTGGNRSRTAQLLGINRGTLYNKLRQYRINPCTRDLSGGEAHKEA